MKVKSALSMLRRWSWAATLALCGCSDLQAVELGICGNHVVESGEDCDGQEHCSAECHFECSQEKKSSCPDGWGCDIGAGICRSNNGGFSQAITVGVSYGQPLVRDFDGDGRADLLLNGGLGHAVPASLLYFDASGQVEKRTSLPSADSASAGDVTGDDLPDLILSSETTTTAFQAKKSRRPSPLIGAVKDVAPDARLFAMDVNCVGTPDFLLLQGHSLVDVTSPDEPELVKTKISSLELAVLEDNPVELTVLHAVGALKNCQMLALPNGPEQTISIYAPGAASGSLVLKSTVTYDTANVTRLFFADLNGDGNQDLLLSGDTTDIAFGLGDGTFHSNRENLPKPGQLPDNHTSSYSSDQTLGVYDDGAGTISLVTPSDGYSESASLDVSGDGRKELVAAGSPRSIVIVRKNASGLTSNLTLPTLGTPHFEGRADFDGDGHDDLLVLEKAPSAKAADLIAVLFPPANDPSAVLTELAELSGVRQLAAATAPGLEEQDSNADIGIIYDVGGKTKLGFLSGAADRVPRSEIPPPRQDSGGVIPALGHFREKTTMDLALIDITVEARGDVASDVVDPKTGLPENLDFYFDVELLSIDTNGTSKLQTALKLGKAIPLAALAADLDRDGIDEIYTRELDGMSVVRYQDGKFQQERVLKASGAAPTLGVQDADGDRWPDVFTTDPSENTVVVLQALDGGAKLHRLKLDGCGGALAAATFIQADTDPEPEIVVSCGELTSDPVAAAGEIPLTENSVVPNTLLICDVDWDNDVLIVRPEDDLRGSAAHLATGDFNGDGLQDFATDGDESQVFFGLQVTK